jgi:hypothetical protein
LRRSKAPAGEALNLPPHKGLLSRSLTGVQFNLLAAERRQALLGPAKNAFMYPFTMVSAELEGT